MAQDKSGDYHITVWEFILILSDLLEIKPHEEEKP